MARKANWFCLAPASIVSGRLTYTSTLLSSFYRLTIVGVGTNACDLPLLRSSVGRFARTFSPDQMGKPWRAGSHGEVAFCQQRAPEADHDGVPRVIS